MPTTTFPDPGAAQDVAYAVQLVLGGIFLGSVLPKLRRPAAFRRVVAGYDLLPQWASLISAGVIVIEALLAVAFLSGWLMTSALALAGLTITVFAAATAVNLRRGRQIECGCFGSADEQISVRSLRRLALMAAAVITLAGGGVSGASSPITATWLVAQGPSSVSYLVEVASLSLFVTALAVWALHGPEVATVLSSARNSRRNSE
jgi:hypothetical protein